MRFLRQPLEIPFQEKMHFDQQPQVGPLELS